MSLPSNVTCAADLGTSAKDLSYGPRVQQHTLAAVHDHLASNASSLNHLLHHCDEQVWAGNLNVSCPP